MHDKRSEERLRRRERIMEAAAHVFASKGLEHATMDDVARQASVSKGALYLYFASKDELYLTLAVEAVNKLYQRIENLPKSGPGLERVSRMLECYVQFSLAEPQRFHLSMAWMAPGYRLGPGGELIKRYRAAVVALLRSAVQAVEAGKRDGSIRADLDVRSTTLEVWSGIIGVLLVRMKQMEASTDPPPLLDPTVWDQACEDLDGNRGFDFDRLIPSFTESVLQAIRPRTGC